MNKISVLFILLCGCTTSKVVQAPVELQLVKATEIQTTSNPIEIKKYSSHVWWSVYETTNFSLVKETHPSQYEILFKSDNYSVYVQTKNDHFNMSCSSGINMILSCDDNRGVIGVSCGDINLEVNCFSKQWIKNKFP